MRKLIWAALVAVLCLVGIGAAQADGPSGSTESQATYAPCPATQAEAEAQQVEEGECEYNEEGQLDPPGQHYESGGNEVTCNQENSREVANRAYVYAGSNGIEACADETTEDAAIQGRAIVSFEEQYITADGDENNSGATEGWARFDSNGPRCGDTTPDSDADPENGGDGDPAGSSDATAPSEHDSRSECG